MPNVKEGDGESYGFIPQLSEKDYFKWYLGRFKGLGQKFYPLPDKEWVGHELAEVAKDQMAVTDYPEPVKRYLLEFYQSTDSVEQSYYLCHQLARDLGYGGFLKITDVFAASEQSSLYGAAAQRLGLAQDRVGQYLRVVNDMVKGMFQIIRELRILDERLAYYAGSKDKGAKGEQAELSLKGLWIDLVEGGAKNPGSVLGLGQQLGFAVLPDLFFRTHRKPLDKIEGDDDDAEEKRKKDLKDKNQELADRIKGLPYNEKMKEVLARKLTQYYIWKDSTEGELSVRRKFMIKYFRQYYNTIKLYISWTKPYLKLIRRLNIDVSKADETQLVAAFEGSMIELEFLCKWKLSNKNPFYVVLLVTFEHTTQPKMSFAAEGGFHRGPLHTGRSFITWRAYSWTDKDILKYKSYRDSQDFELLASVDSTLKSALESVEGDIKEYLKALGEEFEKKKKPEEKKETLDLMEPLVEVFKGFWEPVESIYEGTSGLWADIRGKNKKKEDDSDGDGEGWGKSKGMAVKMCFNHYKLYKNANGLLTW